MRGVDEGVFFGVQVRAGLIRLLIYLLKKTFLKVLTRRKNDGIITVVAAVVIENDIKLSAHVYGSYRIHICESATSHLVNEFF